MISRGICSILPEVHFFKKGFSLKDGFASIGKAVFGLLIVLEKTLEAALPSF